MDHGTSAYQIIRWSGKILLRVMSLAFWAHQSPYSDKFSLNFYFCWCVSGRRWVWPKVEEPGSVSFLHILAFDSISSTWHNYVRKFMIYIHLVNFFYLKWVKFQECLEAELLHACLKKSTLWDWYVFSSICQETIISGKSTKYSLLSF